jgi:hypothetical protein
MIVLHTGTVIVWSGFKALSVVRCFRIEVQEGRANLKCPQCAEQLHPNDVEFLVGGDKGLLQLYQFLMVRRVLAADPDTRSILSSLHALFRLYDAKCLWRFVRRSVH